NRIPFGLMRYTCPLAFRCPRIEVPLLPRMRFTAMALAEGCTKSTVSWDPMLKLCQLSDRFWLDCRIVVMLPDWEMLPAPATTWPPGGPACATTAPSDRAGATSLLLAHLPLARVVSATGTHAPIASLQTSR